MNEAELFQFIIQNVGAVGSVLVIGSWIGYSVLRKLDKIIDIQVSTKARLDVLTTQIYEMRIEQVSHNHEGD